MRFEASAEVGAPAHEVFETYADVVNWPEWTASVTSVERLDDGPLRVGSRARVRQPRLPVAVWEVTELLPGQSFTWVARGPGVRTTGTHRVEPLPDGRSRVTAILDQSGPLGPVVGLFTRSLTQTYLQTEVNGIKTHCEK
ncbi:MAG TPA: SRPBCC family protein [Marmoricola sp.]